MNAACRPGLLAAVLLAVAALPAPARGDDKADLLAALERGKKLIDDGKYAEAAANYEKALALAPKVFGANSINVTGIQALLAFSYQPMGEYAKAESLYQQALTRSEARPGGKDDPLTAETLANLASLYRDMGQYAKAEPLLRRALAISEAKLGKDDPATAQVLHNLGVLYGDMGQPAKAEPLLRRALAIREAKLGKDDPDTGRTLNSLGVLYRDAGEYAKAEPLYKRALEIKEARLGADHPDTARALGNLAGLYRDTGQYAKAEPPLRRALAIFEDKLGRDHPDTARALNNLAVLCSDTGQYAKAEPLYRRSLAIREAKLGKDHPATARALNNLANLYANLGKWDTAAQYRDRNRRAVRNYVSDTLPILSDREQEQFLKTQDETSFHDALSYGLVRRGHPAEAALSAGWVLNGKAVAAQARAEQALLARDTRDPQAGQTAKELAEVRRALAALTLQPPKGGQATARARQLADLAAREQDLTRELTRLTGRPARAGWAELADVRKALPQAGVLVEVARFDRKKVDLKPGEQYSLGDRYAAWVIPPTGDIRVIDLGEAGPIDAAVRGARTELEASAKTIREKGEPAAEAQLREPLEALARLVLHPLLPHIGQARTWVVSPDSNLWLVPWAALPLPGGAYAVEKHTVTYLVTGRDLLAAKNDKVRPTAPLVLADPDFDLGPAEAEAITRQLVRDPPGGHRGLPRGFKLGGVRRLPGTAVEAAAIAPRLKQYAGLEPRVCTDKQALAGVFMAATNPRVVVLSTHGFFLEGEETDRKDGGRGGPIADGRQPTGPAAENPLLRCGLLLAGCNHAGRAGPGADTGVLTGLEIVGTDLRGTELVVLSACETGLGDVRNGEGVAGLRQAFQLAGAESVVATLWQVPDRESALLAAAFFDGLARGRPRDAALAEAQRAAVARRRDRAGAAHPFFWAAYTLTGQTR